MSVDAPRTDPTTGHATVRCATRQAAVDELNGPGHLHASVQMLREAGELLGRAHNPELHSTRIDAMRTEADRLVAAAAVRAQLATACAIIDADPMRPNPVAARGRWLALLAPDTED